MSARGVALAGALATLAALALALRPSADAAMVAAAVAADPVAATVVLESVGAPAIAAASLRHAAEEPATVWSLRPTPMPATPSAGVAAILHQPRFAPRIDIAAEVWAAFVGSPDGDAGSRWSAVADRLARLGLAAESERPWPGGGLDLPRGQGDGEVRVAVVVTAASVGAVVLASAGGSVEVPLFGAAELQVAAAEAWAWSASSFPGPHRLGPGVRVPGAALRVVAITRHDPLTLAFSEPLSPVAGTLGVPCFAVARRERALPPGTKERLALLCDADGWTPIEIPLGDGARRGAVVEFGRPFGTYGTSRIEAPARASSQPGR